MNNQNNDYLKKENSFMFVAICPTTSSQMAMDNINTVNRVIEMTGGIIVYPCPVMEARLYREIAESEEDCTAEFFE